MEHQLQSDRKNRFFPYYLNSRRVSALADVDPPAHSQRSLANNSGQRVDGMDEVLRLARGVMAAGDIPNLVNLAANRDLEGDKVLAYIWGVFAFEGAREAVEREQEKTIFKPATFGGRIPLADREYQFTGEMFNEHYYSNSSLRSLSNTVRMFIVGHFRFEGNHVEVFPYIMGEFEEKIGIHRTNWSDTLRIYPEAIDAFRGINDETISNGDLEALAAIPEKQIKEIFAELIGEPFVVKDWAGEKSDLSTNRLVVNGRPMAAAFILKGPSLKGEMHPKNMGKRGDQLVRVFDEPVELVVVQHCNKIANTVVRQAEALAYNPGGPRRYCIIDGADTARILKAHRRLYGA